MPVHRHATGPPMAVTGRGRHLLDRDGRAHRAERSMQAGLGRPERDAERLGDPRERHVEIEVHDDDRPRLRLESGEDPIELVAVGDPHRRIERRRVMERGELDLDHAAPALADEVDAGVDDEAVQPVVERRRFAQPRQATPSPDQGLLDGVLGKIRVTEDEAGRSVQTRAGCAGKLSEGMPVASPGSLHESDLVHVHLGLAGATTVVVLDQPTALASPERFRDRGIAMPYR